MTQQEAIAKLPELMALYKHNIQLLQENLELLNRLHQGLEAIVNAIQK